MPKMASRGRRAVFAALLGTSLLAASCFAPIHHQGLFAVSQISSIQQAEAKVYAPTVSYYKKMYTNTDDVKLIMDPINNPKVIPSAPVLKKGTYVSVEGKRGSGLYIRINGHVGWVPETSLTELTELDAKKYPAAGTPLFSRMDEQSTQLTSLNGSEIFYTIAESDDWVYGISSGVEGWVVKSALSDTQEAPAVAEEPEPAPVEEDIVQEEVQPEEKSALDILTTPPLVYVVGAAFVLIALGLIASIVRLLRR